MLESVPGCLKAFLGALASLRAFASSNVLAVLKAFAPSDVSTLESVFRSLRAFLNA